MEAQVSHLLSLQNESSVHQVWESFLQSLEWLSRMTLSELKDIFAFSNLWVVLSPHNLIILS